MAPNPDPSPAPAGRAGPGQPRFGPELSADGSTITFTVPDRRGAIPVRVWFHLIGFGADPRFAWRHGVWVASIPRPPAVRLEYLIEWRHSDGGTSLEADPGNELGVTTVFGRHSVIEFPGYQAPAWLSAPEPERGGTALSVVDRRADVRIEGVLHSPPDTFPGRPLPLLIAHDGPEYDDLSQLRRYLGHLRNEDPRLSCRVLLLQPHQRNRSYGASPAYARLFAQSLVPRVRAMAATRGPVLGMGASLGGLAMLHIALRHPGTLGGVFSQSGSFFRPDYDDQERGFTFFGRISDFVSVVDDTPAESIRAFDATLTCGTAEENHANNARMVRVLQRKGIPTAWHEHPDGHNYVSWRDTFDPALRQQMERLWLPPRNASAQGEH